MFLDVEFPEMRGRVHDHEAERKLVGAMRKNAKQMVFYSAAVNHERGVYFVTPRFSRVKVEEGPEGAEPVVAIGESRAVAARGLPIQRTRKALDVHFQLEVVHEPKKRRK